MGWFSKIVPINPLALAEPALNWLSAEKDRKAQREANSKNEALQREFATMGIRWKVDDARAAGIHPLIALGASGYSASPSHIAEPAGAGIRGLGQDISRAVKSTMTAQERLESELRLENMRLQNNLLKGQIDGLNRPNNPPLPSGGTDNFIGGQGDSGLMLVKPSERTAHQRGRPAQEAGARPDVSYSRTDTGLVPVIPQGLSESMEDDMVGKLLWRIRNQIAPNLSGTGSPPKSQLPSWADRWRWDRFKQEWVPVYSRRRGFIRETMDKFRYTGG